MAPVKPTHWFRCLHCGVARRAGLSFFEICLYCLEYPQKFCVYGDHEADQKCFVGDDGVEYDECNGCREGLRQGREVGPTPND